MSSDSIPSLLGGDPDGDAVEEEALSFASLSVGDPATPASIRRQSGSPAGERMRGEKKQPLSPPAMDCAVDHPLLGSFQTPNLPHTSCIETMGTRPGVNLNARGANIDIKPFISNTNTFHNPNTYATLNRNETSPNSNSSNESSAINQAQPDSSFPLTNLRTSFKSNLTASFNVIASAARAFSNFTAPSLPPDDLLTRSLLAPNPSSAQNMPSHCPSVRFPSEMRPKPVDGLPEAALRRYLNPGAMTGTMPSTSAVESKRVDVERQLRMKRTIRPSGEAEAVIAIPPDINQDTRSSRPDIARQLRLKDDRKRHNKRDGNEPGANDSFKDIDSNSCNKDYHGSIYEHIEDEKQSDSSKFEDEMIPLEPYRRPSRNRNAASLPTMTTSSALSISSSSSASSAPTSTSLLSSLVPTIPSHQDVPSPTRADVHARPREPRENSDFLRIVVLEMNMRRSGKLDGDLMGKARVWLPPRRERAGVDGGGNGGGGYSIGNGAEKESRGRYAGTVTGVGLDDEEAAAAASTMVVPRRWIGEVSST